MMNNLMMKTLFFIFLFSSFLLVRSSEPLVYDVDYEGAVGDGESDDTEAFRRAWEAICRSHASSSTFRVSKGKKYLVHPLTFNGECQSSNFTFQIDGQLIAPSNPSSWECGGGSCQYWITFQHFDGLIIQGEGSFHEQGQEWWKLECNQNNLLCNAKKATGLSIVASNNVKMSGLSFVDSRRRHISIETSSFVLLSNLNITSPENSPDTDGIRIQTSTNVTIHTTSIQTGDDCIGIGDGSNNIYIDRIVCGPGHGISIGSLGNNGRTETVENVIVKHVQFSSTKNGVTIKTWQGGHGYARHIRFEHMDFVDVFNPIVIDQYICPHQPCKNYSSAVEISDVTYNDLYGTSSSETTVKLACSESVPCKNIRMRKIDLDFLTENDSSPKSYCLNVVESSALGELYPSVPCLTNEKLVPLDD